MSDKNNIKIDLTSGAVEKVFELAKDFLSKLITPTFEELGLLAQDSVRMWRFKRQVTMLAKANEYCLKHNIELKTISLKVLVPLLEHAGLEEDDFLHDKWAMLLANMVDSQQNIQNNVFPFILSQISKNEFIKLEEELSVITPLVAELEVKLVHLENERRFQPDPNNYWGIKRIKMQILNTKHIDLVRFEEFEIANLVRLGLIKTISVQDVNNVIDGGGAITVEDDLGIEHIADVYLFTELGKEFFKVCNAKNNT